MIDKQAVAEVVKAHLSDELFLIGVTVSPDNAIVVEIDGYSRGVSIDDCAGLTRAIEAAFDRDVEDYELEVGSAGLTAPYKVRAQYDKNIGEQVEVLTADGRKLRGELLAAGDEGFTIGVEKMVLQEGAKRKTPVTEEITLRYNETKYTKNLIQFK